MIWNERATPLRGDPVRGEAGDVFAVETDRAAGRLDPAGQHVEERRLAGAVRSHDAVEFALADREVDIFQHDAIAEADMDALASISAIGLLRTAGAAPTCLARRIALSGRCCEGGATAPAMPSGLNSTISDEQQAEPEHPGVGQRADHVARDQEQRTRRPPVPRS